MSYIKKATIAANRKKVVEALRTADEASLRCRSSLINEQGRFCAFGYAGHVIGLKVKDTDAMYRSIARWLGISYADGFSGVTSMIINMNDGRSVLGASFRHSWPEIGDYLADEWEIV